MGSSKTLANCNLDNISTYVVEWEGELITIDNRLITKSPGQTHGDMLHSVGTHHAYGYTVTQLMGIIGSMLAKYKGMVLIQKDKVEKLKARVRVEVSQELNFEDERGKKYKPTETFLRSFALAQYEEFDPALPSSADCREASEVLRYLEGLVLRLEHTYKLLDEVKWDSIHLNKREMELLKAKDMSDFF